MVTRRQTRNAAHGLSLHKSVLNALRKRGIYCETGVTIEHQHLAKRYVLRGVESGGSVSDMGRACAFVASDGSSLPWLQRIDSLSVNGRHAVFVAEEMVRLEILRVGHTCELVISQFALSFSNGSIRPKLDSRTLFRGRDGVMPVELWREDQRLRRGRVSPIFYTRAGESLVVPERFVDAIHRLTEAVCCVGCKHVHVGEAPPTQ